MNKICNKCNQLLPLSDFGSKIKSKDGLNYTCKNCRKNFYQKTKNSPSYQARKAWGRLNWRAQNKRGDLPTYTNVEVRMTKNEFFNWAIPQYEEWAKNFPNLTPSINRKNAKGHYELENIEMISWGENSSKRQPLKSPEQIVQQILTQCKHNQIDLSKIIHLLQNQ